MNIYRKKPKCLDRSSGQTMQTVMSRKENPQKLTQLSSRSHPRHLLGKRTAQKDTTIDITSDSQVNSNAGEPAFKESVWLGSTELPFRLHIVTDPQ